MVVHHGRRHRMPRHPEGRQSAALRSGLNLTIFHSSYVCHLCKKKLHGAFFFNFVKIITGFL